MRVRPFASCIALCLFSQAAHAIPSISFDPGVNNVLVGDIFSLTLQGTGFDLTADSKIIDNLTGGQKFNLEFDPALLEVLSISIDPRWTFTSGNKTGTVDNVGGFVTGMAFGTFPATTDDNFNIASITFRALGAGQTPVIVYGGEFAAKVASLAGAKVLPGFESASVQVTAIPEPVQWAMMLAGLGLVGWRMRRQ